jgi:5'-3' exonuclease
MPQPIPKKIKENNPNFAIKSFNTLLIDGSSLLELVFNKSKKTSSDGQEIGAIFAFLLQLKILLQKGNFRYVYCFWDGDNSGQLRYDLNSDYKANRDKNYVDNNLSDYMKEVNARISYMQKKIYGDMNRKPSKTDEEKENFHWQREILIQCLDELFIRQCLYDGTEADDFIAYYVGHKKPEENIVIFSNDRDLSQLIHKSTLNPEKDDVILAIKKPRQEGIQFINSRNHTEMMGYNYQNVALKKIICGDVSDNIKGIKGVGEKTLFDNFPQFKERKVTLDEVIDGARKINEDRAKNKQKPLKWAENIVNHVTDGAQGEHVYEINEKIIDLQNPLMSDEAKELIDSMMYAPMDPEGRSLQNLYRLLLEYNIDDLKDENRFGNFFTEFKFLIDKEQNDK